MKKYKGSLNREYIAQIGPSKIKVPYVFKSLDGIPQAGDLEMSVLFTADGKEYAYYGDGWNFEASEEGEKVNPEKEIASLGTIEVIASELVEHYLRSIAPKDAVDEWIDNGTYRIKKGDLVEEV